MKKVGGRQGRDMELIYKAVSWPIQGQHVLLQNYFSVLAAALKGPTLIGRPSLGGDIAWQ